MNRDNKELSGDAGCGCLFVLLIIPFIIALWRWALF